MRVKYKPERGRYDAAVRWATTTGARCTAAGRRAAADWLSAGTGRRVPPPSPRSAATNNFKFLFMFLATTVAAVESARTIRPYFA